MADLGDVGLSAEVVSDSVVLMSVGVVPLFTKSVSGVITDDTNTECARTVRMYSRATGQLISETLSDAVTGEFAMDAPDEEVQRVVLDDAAGTLYNDLIDRVLPGP